MIADRDGWSCHLCGELIDPTQTVPGDWAPTIDHIVPVSAGGEHTLSNVRLAHFWCNSIRSARTVDEARTDLGGALESPERQALTRSRSIFSPLDGRYGGGGGWCPSGLSLACVSMERGL